MSCIATHNEFCLAKLAVSRTAMTGEVNKIHVSYVATHIVKAGMTVK